MKKSTVRLLARSARPVCIARTSTNGGWEFDYSAHVGTALDRIAAAKLLTR
jgi:hypothetical protein